MIILLLASALAQTTEITEPTQVTPVVPVITCNTFCNGCSSEFSCTTCVPGALKQPGSDLCRDLCPMGSRPSMDYKTCESTPKRIINFDMASAAGQYLTDNSGYMVAHKGEYSSADKLDPTWLTSIGLEFLDEDQVKGLTPFVLGQSYTFSAWIKPTMLRDQMPIFTKTQNESEEENEAVVPYVFKIFLSPPDLTYNRSVTLYFKNPSEPLLSSTVSSLSTISSNSWNHIAVVVTYALNTSTVSFWNNGVLSGSANVPGFFWDDYLHSWFIGTDGDFFFDGILRELSFYNYGLTNLNEIASTVCNGSCSVCPPSGECIVMCDRNQYRDSSGACQTCGPLCDRCISADICDACVLGASPVLGTNSCTCGIGMGHDGTSCQPCYAHCVDCTYIYSCTSCTLGSVTWPSGFCREVCPAGYTAVAGTCVGLPSTVFDFEFDSHSGILLDKIAGYQAELAGISTPIPTRERGWFFGGQTYAILPPNIHSPAGVLFNTDFTVVTWYKSDPLYQEFDLIGKYSPIKQTFAIHFDKPKNIPALRTMEVSISCSEPGNYHKGEAAIGAADGVWNFLALRSSYNGGMARLTLNLNGLEENIALTDHKQKALSPNAEGPFMDDLSYKFILGAQWEDGIQYNEIYTGFIKELSLYNYAATDMNTLSKINGPTSLCPVETFVNSTGGCTPCDLTCTSCVRATDCNLCFDKHCADCLGRVDDFCQTCVGTMETNGRGACECRLGYSFDASTSSCVDIFVPPPTQAPVQPADVGSHPVPQLIVDPAPPEEIVSVPETEPIQDTVSVNTDTAPTDVSASL